MVVKLLVGWCLMGMCVVIHAAGLAVVVRWSRRQPAVVIRFWTWTWVLTRLAAWIILLHLVEITVWGAYYLFQGAMPDLPSALYFSAVTYTTTGYGDLVLPSEWRLVGAIEALTGILMCGLSTGFFFAAISRMFREP
jgi:Ion channel